MPSTQPLSPVSPSKKTEVSADVKSHLNRVMKLIQKREETQMLEEASKLEDSMRVSQLANESVTVANKKKPTTPAVVG